MHSWNTIFPVNTNKLDEAILVLEAVSEVNSFPILEFLREFGDATILDLSLHTGLDTDSLECQIELLCCARVLNQEEDILGSSFSLNYQRLEQVSSVAHALANRSR